MVCYASNKASLEKHHWSDRHSAKPSDKQRWQSSSGYGTVWNE